MDKPFSPQTEAMLAGFFLAFAMWILGHRVGMEIIESIAFAIMSAGGVMGLVKYLKRRDDDA
ncbi:hypothetical protein [Bradyrhizobium sp. WSM1417]|uniref:hypothetical protein n=1 Tax=Bradyrhizobium sp. WSM1417 TaxID=754500 RepID=UPI0004AFC369|nr:hypothetical protein [Bradyrhizobium sp. WSM1417]